MACSLPDWALSAIDESQKWANWQWKNATLSTWWHNALRERLQSRWEVDIKRVVLPCLGGINDDGRQEFFFQLLTAACKAPGEGIETAREAREKLFQKYRRLASTINRLNRLIGEAKELEAKHSFSSRIVDLWDALEDAAAKYPAWLSVSEDKYREFIEIATRQSRESPEITDLLAELEGGLPSGEDDIDFPPHVIEGYLASRKKSADGTRFITWAVDEFFNKNRDNSEPERTFTIPPSAELTDRAIAILAEVLLGKGAGAISSKRINDFRQEHRKRKSDSLN